MMMLLLLLLTTGLIFGTGQLEWLSYNLVKIA